MKLDKLESDQPEATKAPVEVKDEPKEEMGGTLVYDSYSKPKGNPKIEEYFNSNPPLKLSTDILFSKAEIKDVSKDIFGEKARERDFGNDQEKYFFKNLPKF